MLVRADRLRRAKDFALLSQKGRGVFGSLFTLRFRESKLPTKVGFVTSAKIFKTAVSRNRAKRRFREALRALKTEWPKNMDLLFIAKPEVREIDFQELILAVRKAFEKIPEALTRPPQPRKNLKARRPSSVVFQKEK